MTLADPAPQPALEARIRHFPNLDGLRAIAALAVVLFHTTFWLSYPQDQAGWVRRALSFNGGGGPLGVQFFFVLSGFLITYLMFLERAETGAFSVWRFYARRALRIWPLYFATLFVGFVAFPAALRALGRVHEERVSWPLYAGFLANFEHVRGMMPGTGILGVQWSVAIEEQFYLVWPLLFVSTNRRAFVIIVAALVVTSFVFYAHHAHDPIGYYHTLCAAGLLGFGALIASISFFHVARIRQLLARVSRSATLAIYAVCLGFAFSQHTLVERSWISPVLARLVIVIFFGFVLLEQNHSPNSLLKIGRFSVLSWLGKISYGLYLTHMIAMYPVMLLLGRDPGVVPAVAGSLAVVLLTILISALSYSYLEGPFLRLKPATLPPEPADLAGARPPRFRRPKSG